MFLSFCFRFKGLESLTMTCDFERPRILCPDQVLIRVQAGSVDPADVLILSGLGRNERRSDSDENSVVLGRDFSGVVVEVGVGVDDLKVGDGVWSAIPLAENGALCEYVVLPASQVVI